MCCTCACGRGCLRMHKVSLAPCTSCADLSHLTLLTAPSACLPNRRLQLRAARPTFWPTTSKQHTTNQVSATYVEMPIVVHEFMPGAASDEPVLFNRRAKIWHQAMPPDQLNPAGHIDGDLASFMPTQVLESVCIVCDLGVRGGALWHQAVPPDQLNLPRHIDGDLLLHAKRRGLCGCVYSLCSSLPAQRGRAHSSRPHSPLPATHSSHNHPQQGRATVRKGARAAGGPLSHDARAGFLPLPLPPPGEPACVGSANVLTRRPLSWQRSDAQPIDMAKRS